MPSVPQTSVIFFALLVGFIVFITLHKPTPGGGPGAGQLAQYLNVIGLEGATKAAPAASNLPTRTGGITAPGTITVSV